ncbi:hydrolase [Aliiroseovarius sp. PTFE2010]|uniref:hydrolase n=1 Tax=Aliiroseovarius sp. PTFE2010 TaxID=3417190 RepID=UPI003CEA67BB
MDTNALPDMNMNAPETACCPKFDPKGWDGRHLSFHGQPIVRATTRSLVHDPINMGQVFTRVQGHIEDAGAQDPDDIFVLSRDQSATEGEHFFRVIGDVPGEDVIRLSGDFITRVFEGSNRQANNRVHEMETAAEEKQPCRLICLNWFGGARSRN